MNNSILKKIKGDFLSTEKSTNNSISILVVDDDPVYRHTIVTFLKNRNYEVEEALDGEEAFKKIQSKKYDYMIADLIMPKMLGTDLVKKAVQIQSTLKIIMITGMSQSLGVEDFSITPIRKYLYGTLIKPFEINDLLNLLI